MSKFDDRFDIGTGNKRLLALVSGKTENYAFCLQIAILAADSMIGHLNKIFGRVTTRHDVDDNFSFYDAQPIINTYVTYFIIRPYSIILDHADTWLTWVAPCILPRHSTVSIR